MTGNCWIGSFLRTCSKRNCTLQLKFSLWNQEFLTPPVIDNDNPNGLLSVWWGLNYGNVFDRCRLFSNSEGASSSTNPGNVPRDSPSMQMPTPYHQPQTLRSTVMPPTPQLSILPESVQCEFQMAGLYDHLAQTVGPTTMRSSDAWNFRQSDPSTVMPMPRLLNPPRTASPTMMPTPGLPNSQQTSSQTMMPASDMANLQQRATSTIMPRPELNHDRFGTDPSPNFNTMLWQTMTNWKVARMHGQENLMLPVSRILDVILLVHMLKSSKNPRSAGEDTPFEDPTDES